MDPDTELIFTITILCIIIANISKSLVTFTPKRMMMVATLVETKEQHSYHLPHEWHGWASWFHLTSIAFYMVLWYYRMEQWLSTEHWFQSKFVLNLSEGLSWSPGLLPTSPKTPVSGLKGPIATRISGLQNLNNATHYLQNWKINFFIILVTQLPIIHKCTKLQ